MGTAGSWAIDFLHALGNQKPDDKTINLVAAWTQVENTDAAFNPLATTLAHGNYSKFNYANVKNYSTRQEGIDASVITLRGEFYGYKGLREGLLSNNGEQAINSGGFDTWGSGSAKVARLWGIDNRDKPLRSETGSTTTAAPSIGHLPEKNPPHVIPNALGPDGSTTAPHGYSGINVDVPSTAGTVSAEGVQKFFKFALGGTVALVASIVLIYSISKTDSVQSAVSVAKVAAL